MPPRISVTPTILHQARIPADLRRTIERIAREAGQSLNATTVSLLRAGVSSRQKEE